LDSSDDGGFLLIEKTNKGQDTWVPSGVILAVLSPSKGKVDVAPASEASHPPVPALTIRGLVQGAVFEYDGPGASG